MFESVSYLLLGAVLVAVGIAYGFRKASEAFRVSERVKEQHR